MTTGARSNGLEDPDRFSSPSRNLRPSSTRRTGRATGWPHAEGLEGCAAAIRHGADTIEHGMYLHRRPDLLEAMAAAGQALVPTLSGYYWMAGLGEAIDPATGPREAMTRR